MSSFFYVFCLLDNNKNWTRNDWSPSVNKTTLKVKLLESIFEMGRPTCNLMGKTHRSVWKISIDLVLGTYYLRGDVSLPPAQNVGSWMNECLGSMDVFPAYKCLFFFQSGSSWKSSREKVRVMLAPLRVYKAQSYSVSSLPTPKVTLRILRRVRTHTFSTFKAVSAIVYFFCIFICLGQSLCTQGGANSRHNLNDNDQVVHKPPSN